MTHATRYPAVVALVTCALALSPACQRSESRAASASQDVQYDERLTDTARVLAGLAPRKADRFAGVLATDAWRNWQKEFDQEWLQADTTRFTPMSAWRKAHLDPAIAGCGTLLYPFSGPDILNAILLFPDCRRYVLFGLEHTGSLPALDRITAERTARLAEELRQALGDLMTRNYAITRHMMKDMAAPELHGNFPLLAVFLARLDAKIVSARDMQIAEDGALRPAAGAAGDRKAAPALEIVFARPGRAAQALLYFRAEAQDAAIRQRPGVVPFLEGLAPFVTFLKSASYLLHGNQFTVVRAELVQYSRLILQDDSGIPLRFLRPPDWSVTFFGRYLKPVKDFNYGYQPDLALAYSTQEVKPLTFSFGYHWETGSSTMMLALRSSQPVSRR